MKAGAQRTQAGAIRTRDEPRGERPKPGENLAAMKVAKASARVLRASGTAEVAARGAAICGGALRSLPVSSLAAGIWCETACGGS